MKDPKYNLNTSSKSKNRIKVNNDFFTPIEFDIFAVAFPNGSEGFLRGSSGAIFPHISSSHKMLFDIMKAFYNLSFKNGYEALQKYHNPLLRELFSQSEISIKNVYQDLSQGAFSEDYFRQGFAIFVGQDDFGSSPGHYSVIVNSHQLLKTIGNITYYFYPADDPFYSNPNIINYVVAPNTTNQDVILELKKSKGNLKIITTNCAIRL